MMAKANKMGPTKLLLNPCCYVTLMMALPLLVLLLFLACEVAVVWSDSLLTADAEAAELPLFRADDDDDGGCAVDKLLQFIVVDVPR